MTHHRCGKDGNVPDGRERDEPLLERTDQLHEELVKLFPKFSDVKVAYRWTGSFGSIGDGMPLIGAHPAHPNCYYALGFGGNGTVYYAIAAEVIRDLIVHGHHPDAKMFSAGRMRWYNQAIHSVGKLFGAP